MTTEPTGSEKPLPDGLHQVTTRYFCAGFVVENGKVTRCAPILRKQLARWMLQAKHVPCQSVA